MNLTSGNRTVALDALWAKEFFPAVRWPRIALPWQFWDESNEAPESMTSHTRWKILRAIIAAWLTA